MIWYNKNISLEYLNQVNAETMGGYLDMRWTEITEDSLSASMPVDHRTHQPYGLLHGGASCVLAESVGSMASMLVLNPDKFSCVGLEINANHLRGVREGRVTGTARPVHLGGSTHVWDIRIVDDRGKLTCISRLTVAVLKIRPGGAAPRLTKPSG